MVQTRRRKRGKVYLHDVNRKKLWLKEKRKREVRVRHCPLIRENWESKLSVLTNYHLFMMLTKHFQYRNRKISQSSSFRKTLKKTTKKIR